MGSQSLGIVRFGIPGLDQLLGPAEGFTPRRFGVALLGHSTTVCIIGKDGTGKSILALHLMSRYLADASAAGNPGTKGIYVSTDLGHDKALSIWERFCLNLPNLRANPLDGTEADADDGPGDQAPAGGDGLELALKNCALGGIDDMDELAAELVGVTTDPGVAFIDMTRSTIGDEWGLLTRLTGGLSDRQSAWKHLLVIDAVEGLETMVGERDAFGEERTRRSRIAQLMRIAKDRCHMVFIVEESPRDARLPEEFVADMVIRLCETDVHGYTRRTVSVEKLRGQAHVRGQHSITLRSGRGSKTKKASSPDSELVENLDDPTVPHPMAGRPGGALLGGPTHQSYVKVYPSLHARNRAWMRVGVEHREPWGKGYARFGIAYLDDLLVQEETGGRRGLPPGRVAALIGEAGTHKLDLSRCFLAEAFSGLRSHLGRAAWSPPAAQALDQSGASILITTSDTDAPELASQFARWLLRGTRSENRGPARAWLESELLRRILCRRLEIHDLPASILFDIVGEAVEGVVRGKGRRPPVERAGVRLVLEDLRIWKQIYPDLSREALFLPSLLFDLRRRGITTLVIDSSQGQPEPGAHGQDEDQLRSLADVRLFTWRVPFYGESRVAIAAIPPLSVDGAALGHEQIPRALVRELRCPPVSNELEHPVVDPHFELYKGIEAGKPEPVPIEICLFSETDQVKAYIEQVNHFLEGVFTPFRRRRVIRAVPMDEYKTLRDYCRGQLETQLDHTLLLQLDEFWLPSTRRTLRSQAAYLGACTWKNGKTDWVVDAQGVFPAEQREGQSPDERQFRYQFFRDNNGYALCKQPGQVDAEIDRIPFTWDFGFLLCQVAPWQIHADRRIPSWYSESGAGPRRVGEIWASLPRAWGYPDGRWVTAQKAGEVIGARATWREFLGACKTVAEASSSSGANRLLPFDVCLLSSESFSCFVLEVWMSELYSLLRPRVGEARAKEVEDWVARISVRRWNQPEDAPWLFQDPLPGPDLEGLCGYAFFRAWLLLVDVLDLSKFGMPERPFEPVSRDADTQAVATRYWYKMACAAQQRAGAPVTVATGLPGHFSTRGDWFLGVARESRSSRLADRALDFLSSRRANFERMQLGIGLPTRNVEGDDGGKVRALLKGPAKDGPCNRETMSNVSFDAVKGLGAAPKDFCHDFYWLWRSSFRDYDQLNAIWQKSLARIAIAWQDFKRDRGAEWVPGFEVYDFLTRRQGTSRVALDNLPDAEEGPLNTQLSQSARRFGETIAMIVRLFRQASSPVPCFGDSSRVEPEDRPPVIASMRRGVAGTTESTSGDEA